MLSARRRGSRHGDGRRQLRQRGHRPGRDRRPGGRRRGLAVRCGRQQAKEARKARELSSIISLFNAHQSDDEIRIRGLIRSGKIIHELDDPETRLQLRHYINQLNFIAVLRGRQLLSHELVKDLFYDAASSCWEQCAKPFIREIRATQNDDFARDLQAWIGAPDP